MNRTDLYRILPHPEEIGQSEYWAIHNLLVDAVNEWVSTDSEDVSLFATTLLEEDSVVVIGQGDSHGVN